MSKDPYAGPEPHSMVVTAPQTSPGYERRGHLTEKQTETVRAFIKEVATIKSSIAGDVLVHTNPEMLLNAIIDSAKQVAKIIGA